MDLSCDYIPSSTTQASTTPSLKTSNPATISHSLGGVGQNVATASHYAGARTRLCSLVGDDLPGKAIIAELEARGMDTTGIQVSHSGSSTAQYVAINDRDKDLVLAMADMAILEDTKLPFSTRWAPSLSLSKPKWAILDGNWSATTLREWIQAARAAGAKIAYEPVSVEKSTRLLHEDWKTHLDTLLQTKADHSTQASGGSRLVDLAAPNALEAIALAGAISGLDAWTSFLSSIPPDTLKDHVQSHLGPSSSAGLNIDAALASLKLLSRIPLVLTKCGPSGVLHVESLAAGDARLSDPEEQRHILTRKLSSAKADSPRPRFVVPEVEEGSTMGGIAGVYLRHYPVPEEVEREKVVSVNGVGDTFLGIVVAGLATGDGGNLRGLVEVAQRGAALTLLSGDSVSLEVRNLMR